MFRQRLVRQSAVSNSSSSAVSNSSSTESTKMPSPPSIRKRRNTQDSKLYRPLSTDSLDHLLIAASSSPSSSNETRKLRNRRHSIACGVLYVDIQRPSLKSAFNSAVRRMSDACCLHLSSAPSSTYNLSAPAHTQPVPKKEGDVVLPQSLGTFRQNRLAPPKPSTSDRKYLRSKFQNRRFSTDPPPPSYSEATSGWKQGYPRQKYLPRQQDIVTSSASSASGEEQERGKQDL